MINTQSTAHRKSSSGNSSNGYNDTISGGDANDGVTINPSSPTGSDVAAGCVVIGATSSPAIYCPSDNSTNKIFITNVIESSAIEMNDGIESNINNSAYNVCGADVNNALNCIRTGVERNATRPSSTGSVGTMRSSDSGTCTAAAMAGNHHLSPATSSLSPIQLSPCRSLDSVKDEELDEITKLFETKTQLIERWLREKASPEILTRVHNAAEYARLPKSPKRTSSVTSDLFQMWLASSSPMQVSCEFGFYRYNIRLDI